MALLTDVNSGFDTQNNVYYIQHTFGTQSTQSLDISALDGSPIDALAWTITVTIEEIDTPPGTLPIPGYTVPVGGEVWRLTDADTVKVIDGATTRVTFKLPSGIGAAVADNMRRSGAPQTRPQPGRVKYYHGGVLFTYPNQDSLEMEFQLRLRYSVVNQNQEGEGG